MKYAPLQAYLKELPASKKSVTLRFQEIEKIIKAKLPKSAFEYEEWWANQSYGSQAPSWFGAGFVRDSVDLDRTLVRFRRNGAAPKEKNPARKTRAERMNREAVHHGVLLKAGFKKFGYWELENKRIHLVGDIPTEAGVYAHVVNGKIYYVGVATMGLKKRLYFYGKPGSTQRTSIRVNGLIKEELKAGRTVGLIAAFPGPTSWSGLPVDTVTGLESGLVKKFSPPWNKRGVAG